MAVDKKAFLSEHLTPLGSGATFHSSAYCSLPGVGRAARYSQPWVTIEAVGKSLPSPAASSHWNNRRCLSERAALQSGSCPVPPCATSSSLASFPSRLAYGTGRGREVCGPSWDGLFLLFALLQPLMSGHDSLLLIKGFLCQVNQAELGGKLQKGGLTLGSRGCSGMGKPWLHRGLWNSAPRR